MRAALLLLAAALCACGIPDHGPTMEAGNDCLSCHNGAQAQKWTVAGTVFDTMTGAKPVGVEGAQVYVSDAKGRWLTLTANSVGNFYTAEDLTPPMKVQVAFGSKRMAMVSAPPSGSCNSCHSNPGLQDAPGRLFIQP